MEFLTDSFERVAAPEGAGRGLLGMLRADMAAKAAWYRGCTGRALSLRMLLSDGSLCSVLYRLVGALKRWHLGPLAALVYKLNAFLHGGRDRQGGTVRPGPRHPPQRGACGQQVPCAVGPTWCWRAG